jgi:hypothetical protein
MSKGKKPTQADIPEDRLKQIKAAARSGVNWATLVDYGAACRCGVPRKLGVIGHDGLDDGECKRHPKEERNGDAGLSHVE